MLRRTTITFTRTIARSYSLVTRLPPASAPREVPTPLVFVSASRWDPSSDKGFTLFSSMLAEKGFTCIQNDLDLPPFSSTDSQQLLSQFESALETTIRMSTIPFPPVIIARSAGCLIAETYISSHPASGLFLISPPLSNASVPKSILPTPLPEFDYEPNFPLALMSTPTQLDALQAANHRLVNDSRVDHIISPELSGGNALILLERWLDEIGI